METEGSVTQWLSQLKAGDERAAQEAIWNRYSRRLMGLARKKLGGLPRREMDEEDVALCALNSLFRGVREDRFPQLKDRNNLWALLSKITARKAINEQLRQRAEKRDPARIISPGDESKARLLEQFPDTKLTPSFLVMMQEQCRRLLDKPGSPTARKVAEMKLWGHTNAEIAEALGVVVRTVERKLRLIRRRWLEDLEQ